jgi:hypothetical protein
MGPAPVISLPPPPIYIPPVTTFAPDTSTIVNNPAVGGPGGGAAYQPYGGPATVSPGPSSTASSSHPSTHSHGGGGGKGAGDDGYDNMPPMNQYADAGVSDMQPNPSVGPSTTSTSATTATTSPSSTASDSPAPPPKRERYKTPFTRVVEFFTGEAVDQGIEHVVPVYGPIKTVYDTTETLGPKINESLERSRQSNELHDENTRPAREAIDARREQGGGVFQPNLNQDWMQ